ncbi:MAG: hypothetical protein R3F31_20600 [Verrucomicrobiales bacterium]
MVVPAEPEQFIDRGRAGKFVDSLEMDFLPPQQRAFGAVQLVGFQTMPGQLGDLVKQFGLCEVDFSGLVAM